MIFLIWNTKRLAIHKETHHYIVNRDSKRFHSIEARSSGIGEGESNCTRNSRRSVRR